MDRDAAGGLPRVARAGLSLLLGAWGLYGADRPESFVFLNDIDLAIHETGHLVFAPFGEIPGILGGTLLQLALPLVFGIALWRRGDRHGAMICLWWAGQNCFHVAPYVADARAMELPLVGGGEHDWFNLLDHWDLLERDQVLAGRFRLAGWLVTLGATLAGVKYALWRPGPDRNVTVSH